MKIRNFMGPKAWTIAAVVVIVILVKIYWDYTCPGSGCYGPFKIVIKAENGERVEDVIVQVTRITSGSFGYSTHTYKEAVIGNTDEVIRLPRGYVGKSSSPNLKMHYSILHPEYTASLGDLDVRFPNQKGVIDLGEKTIVHERTIYELDLVEEIATARASGSSEAQINQMIEERYGTENARLRPRYYAELLDLGREDIFDKYWPVYFEEYAKSEGMLGENKEKNKRMRLEIIERQRE